MKFSIIIPAYNAEQTLEKCLRSVQRQSYTDFEAIIVDDGSIDGTALIGKTFARTDMRFRYIYHENQGVSATRNRGLDEAKGEFVVFLDSDDQYDREYLQEFNRMTVEYPDCDHFWCGFKSIDISGNQLAVSVWKDNDGVIYVLDRNVIMNLHEKTLDAALWNKAYRKKILDENNIKMDEGLSLGEDILFNFAYLDVCRTKIVVNSCPMYIYSKAENGTLDSKYRADLKEIYEIINNRLLGYLKKWDVSQQQISKFYSSVFYALERVLYNTYGPECTMTALEKRRFNNNLIKSKEFRTALMQADCSIHPLYRFAYTMGSWNFITLLDGMVKIKKKLKRN